MRKFLLVLLSMSLLLTACGKNKDGLLEEACAKVSKANEITIATQSGDALYKNREEAWKVASEAFDQLASDSSQYLSYSVTVNGMYVAFKETFADVPEESDVQKLGSLCKINLLYLW